MLCFADGVVGCDQCFRIKIVILWVKNSSTFSSLEPRLAESKPPTSWPNDSAEPFADFHVFASAWRPSLDFRRSSMFLANSQLWNARAGSTVAHTWMKESRFVTQRLNRLAKWCQGTKSPNNLRHDIPDHGRFRMASWTASPVAWNSELSVESHHGHLGCRSPSPATEALYKSTAYPTHRATKQRLANATRNILRILRRYSISRN
jgi:hypothetical protein